MKASTYIHLGRVEIEVEGALREGASSDDVINDARQALKRKACELIDEATLHLGFTTPHDEEW